MPPAPVPPSPALSAGLAPPPERIPASSAGSMLPPESTATRVRAAGQVVLTEQARRDRDRSARLGDQVRLRRGPPHRLAYLVLGDRHHVVHMAEQVPQGQGTDLLDPERVGDGPLRLVGRPRHPLAAAERVPRVSRKFRFDPDHPRPGAQGADGGGNPGDETAATDRHHDQVGPGAVRRDLQADGALACDDGPVIERRDERIAVAADQLLRGCHPGRQRRPRGDDPGAQPADGTELDRWCIVWDDHGGGNAQQCRGVGNGSGVIPAGMGHNSARAQVGGKGTDRRIRATQLERARRLQRFRLQQQTGIRAGERHQRGRDDDPAEARGCRPDFINRYKRRHWPTLWPAGHPGDSQRQRMPAADFRKSRKKTGVRPGH